MTQERIRPTISGEKAACPFCGGTVIGKCGEIYAWHWQHQKDRECDPWKEHETRWHRDWKGEFSDELQEIILSKDDEKHRADVQTVKGLVIEFQNSSISTETIRIREAFYGEMIWVVNAESFHENFQLRSAVKSGLKQLDENLADEISMLEKSEDEELEAVQSEVYKREQKLNIHNSAIDKLEDRILNLKITKGNFDDFYFYVLEDWQIGKYNSGVVDSQIANEIDMADKKMLTSIPLEISDLEATIENNEKILDYIQQLETYVIDGKDFKLLKYEQIPLSGFHRARAINKLSRQTFFPEIALFRSQADFNAYSFKTDKFDFAFDPTETVEKLQKQNLAHEFSKEVQRRKRSDLIETMKVQLLLALVNSIAVKEEELAALLATKADMEKALSEWKEKETTHATELAREYSVLRSMAEKQATDKRFKLMKAKKGQYTFAWKHERLSWRAATCPVYFDTGKGFLFERKSNGIFAKISKSDFLKVHI